MQYRGVLLVRPTPADWMWDITWRGQFKNNSFCQTQFILNLVLEYIIKINYQKYARIV